MTSLEPRAEDLLPLPPPREDGPFSLETLLSRRRSLRTFSPLPVTREELSQLLWSAQGVTHPQGFRTAPSAGALYPLETYVVNDQGVFRYVPLEHALVQLSKKDRRDELAHAALEQESISEAPLVVGFTSVDARTARRYGERAPRYAAMEAGHAAQNLLLAAVALDLGAVPIAAFDEERVRELLTASPQETPLYLVPVGRAM